MDERDALRYSVWDPTGNITALVESAVEPARRPAVAAALMRRRPEVEQVGFLRPASGGERAELHMAGGEFCGNASMCAAALCLLDEGDGAREAEMLIRVSGASRPVAVRLRRDGESCFHAAVRIPAPRAVREKTLRFDGVEDRLPLVCMEGISHLLVEPDSPFFALLEDHAAAEEAVRLWCAALGADGLGLMFREGGADGRLTPLVFVPVSGTVFWEKSCASGSAAVGMAESARTGASVKLALREPGGILHVESAPGGETWLGGSTRLVLRFS